VLVVDDDVRGHAVGLRALRAPRPQQGLGAGGGAPQLARRGERCLAAGELDALAEADAHRGARCHAHDGGADRRPPRSCPRSRRGTGDDEALGGLDPAGATFAGGGSPAPPRASAWCRLGACPGELVEERAAAGAVGEHGDAVAAAGDGDVQHPALLLDVLGQRWGTMPSVTPNTATRSHSRPSRGGPSTG
jgi:hypothetical protein